MDRYKAVKYEIKAAALEYIRDRMIRHDDPISQFLFEAYTNRLVKELETLKRKLGIE